MAWPAMNVPSSPPVRIPGGLMTSAAPAPNAVTMSETDGSNPIEASCRMRIPGPRPSCAIWPAARQLRPTCDVATPFGAPVEPEV